MAGLLMHAAATLNTNGPEAYLSSVGPVTDVTTDWRDF